MVYVLYGLCLCATLNNIQTGAKAGLAQEITSAKSEQLFLNKWENKNTPLLSGSTILYKQVVELFQLSIKPPKDQISSRVREKQIS